jgi:hypothetical protein
MKVGFVSLGKKCASVMRSPKRVGGYGIVMGLHRVDSASGVSA